MNATELAAEFERLAESLPKNGNDQERGSHVSRAQQLLVQRYTPEWLAKMEKDAK